MSKMFLSVINSIVYHPFCSVFIVLILWIWANVFFKEIEVSKMSISYQDCVKRKEYWRVFSSILAHKSLFILLLNVNCLWNLRYLEDYYGTFFLFRYTVLLAITEVALSFALIAVTVRGSGNNPLVRSTLHTLNAYGCSGIVLAWLVFQSIAMAYHPIEPVFLLFGLLDVSPSFAPLLVLIIFFLFAGKNNVYSTTSGLINGYLLGSGLLLVLPNFYWSLCFLVDVVIVLIVTAFHAPQQSAPDTSQTLSFRAYQGEQSEELIEMQYDLEATSDAARAQPSPAEAQHFRSRSDYDEEALEPLLEDGPAFNSNSAGESSSLSRVAASIRRTFARSNRDENETGVALTPISTGLSDLMRRGSGYSRVTGDEH